MPWLKVDERFSRGRKVKRATLVLGGGKKNRARVLAVWVDAMSYCNLHLTDGFFPDDELDDLPEAKPNDVFAAMAIGDEQLGPMIERDDRRKGWVFRNYAEYQPTKQDVESKRERDKERKRVHRLSAARPRGQIAASAHTDPIRSDPDRSGPDPTEQDQEQRAVARESHAVLVKIAHGVLDEAESPDIPDGELCDRLKDCAAKARIPYDSRACQKALDAARGHRTRRFA